MNTLTKKILQGTLAATAAAMFFTVTYGCDQQKPRCSSSRGDFVVKYTLVSGDASKCTLKGEMVGVQTYNPAGKGGNPDLDHASVAIQSNTLGTAFDNAALASADGVHPDPNPQHVEYSLGAFLTTEPVNDLCAVGTMNPAQADLPAVTADDDLGTTDQDAVSYTYEWSNVAFYVTAAHYGSQFKGDVKITTGTDVCQYHAIGLYPYVDCTGTDPNDPKATPPDNGACAAEADPDAGRPTGSGINPDYPTVCDPDLLACVLTGSDVPSLK